MQLFPVSRSRVLDHYSSKSKKHVFASDLSLEKQHAPALFEIYENSNPWDEFLSEAPTPSTQENNWHVAPVGTFFAGFPNLSLAIPDPSVRSFKVSKTEKPHFNLTESVGKTRGKDRLDHGISLGPI